MDSLAIVILSCSKPRYVERRIKQAETYKLLKQTGAHLYILLGKTDTTDIEIKKYDDMTTILYSPVSEDYEYLPLRLWSAYKYLSQKGYSHILKIDDDITFKDIDLDTLTYYLNFSLQFDYVALKGAVNENMNQGEHKIALDANHWGMCNNELVNKIFTCYPLVPYAGGPFYLISCCSILKFSESDFRKCFLEDVSLGVACKKYNIPLKNLTHLFKDHIEFEEKTGVHTIFFCYNSPAYNYLLNS